MWMAGTSLDEPGHDSRESLRRRVRKTIALELLAQRGLQDLAGGGMGDAVDEGDVVGHPPLCDLAFHEPEDVFAARLLALLELHDQKRPLVPFGMMHADDGGFGNGRV